jgi:metal-responsive CopG/Arc/MetJ family transcriptional regulator
MAKQKATISIPEVLMVRVDMYASRFQMNRSQICEQALLEFLEGKVPHIAERTKQNYPRD